MAKKPFEGQVALVTGAAKRIGRSIVLRLAEEYDADAEAVASDVRDTLTDLHRRKLIELT